MTIEREEAKNLRSQWPRVRASRSVGLRSQLGRGSSSRRSSAARQGLGEPGAVLAAPFVEGGLVDVGVGVGVDEAAAALLADVDGSERLGLDNPQGRPGPPRRLPGAQRPVEDVEHYGCGRQLGLVGDAEAERVGDLVPEAGEANSGQVVADGDDRPDEVDHPGDRGLDDIVDDFDVGAAGPDVVGADDDGRVAESDVVDPALGVPLPLEGVGVGQEAGIGGDECEADDVGDFPRVGAGELGRG